MGQAYHSNSSDDAASSKLAAVAPPEPIAIIGIGCRFPGANGPESFWRMLCDGVDAIREVPPDRWDANSFCDPFLPGKAATRWGGFVDQPLGAFDALFFGMSPREAMYLDPMQGWLLEVSWEALEDAGIRAEQLAGSRTGVFMGIFTEDAKIFQLRESNRELIGAHTGTGASMTMAANRLSYWFDLRGPSISLDTACSSSLVAIHLACLSLWNGESTLALAGGANAMFQPEFTIAESKAGMLSPEGRCKTFDSQANGYVRGEGAGIVVLKPLSAALADGDDIYALIRGTASNQDGHTTGITVPSGEAQKALAREACRRAGIAPSKVHYIEAHGTGTPVGDPIEAQALGEVFGQGRAEGEPCLVGSVKTNIGHLEAAAGVAGLIKAALCLKHQQIPPHLHLKTPNPQINFGALRLRVPLKVEPWPRKSGPGLAAVNSFGFGGANAHAVLSEAPAPPTPREPPDATGEPEGHTLVALSARSSGALRRLAATYQKLAERHRDGPADAPRLRELASAMARRRSHHVHRLAVVAGSYQEFADTLSGWLAEGTPPGLAAGQAAPRTQAELAFVYTGMGPQWWAMGRALLATEPVFRQAVERCDEILGRWADWSLLAELSATEASSRMRETRISQPANFALQVGLTELLRSWGLTPAAVVGHSTGEVASFWAAGVLDLEQACRVVYHRSRLQHRTSGQGKLVAVGMPYDQALTLIDGVKNVSLAAINSPSSVTLAGEPEVLDRLTAPLIDKGVLCRFLKVDVPFHSHYMDPLRDELVDSLMDLAPRQALTPLYSTVTGQPAQGPELDAAYWWLNVRDPVRFAMAIDNMLADGYHTFLEVGPHPVLAGNISECAQLRNLPARTYPTLRRGGDDHSGLLNSVGALYALGVTPDWKTLFPAPNRPVKLPTYQWDWQVYWAESAESRNDRLGPAGHPLLGRRQVAPQPTWQGLVARRSPAYLEDHAIQGTIVFPGAAYIEMGLAALRQASGRANGAVELSDIQFRSALFLRDEAANLRTVLDLEGQHFTVYSRADATVTTWEPLSTGHLRRVPARPVTPDKLTALQATFQGAETYASATCYERLRALNFEYGPRFQGIRRISVREQESLACIEYEAAHTGEMAGYEIPPPLLDACFQALLVGVTSAGDSQEAYLPVAIDRVTAFAPLPGRLWVHGRMQVSNRRQMTGALDVYADDGRLLVCVEGIRVQSLETSSRAKTLSNLLYELTWSEVTPSPRGEPPPRGTWLLLADTKGLATALAASIEAAGGTALLVRPGEAFGTSEDKLVFNVNPEKREDFERLLAALDVRGRRPERIVHLWGLDAPDTESLETRGLMSAQGPGVVALLHLAQALEKAGGAQPPRLWLITRGARAVMGEAQPLAVAQCPLWGFGSALFQQEHPELAGGIVDLDPAAPAGEVEKLRALMEEPPSDRHLAFRQERLWSDRMVPAPQLADGVLSVRLRADATYLITGGRGGLGLVFARWMLKRGARRLILAGRTALPARRDWHAVAPGSAAGKQIAAIRELEALGASIHPEALDVVEEEQVRDFLTAFRREGWPPLRGVIHAAGVVNPMRFSELDAPRLRATLAPKLAGAWNLHRLLADEPLDFFVLCSSVNALGFSMGVADYAASNYFLDGLAHARRHLGLNGLSMDWGAWGEVGMASDEQVARDFERRGIIPFQPEQGVAALERCLEHDCRQVIVLDADWPRLLQSSYQAAAPPLLQPVIEQLAAATSAGGANESEEQSVRAQLAQLEDAAARKQVLEAFLGKTIARSLRLAPEQVTREQLLQGFGLDSIIAVELRHQIMSGLGVSPTVIELLQGASVASLAERLLPQLQPVASEGEDLEALAAQLEALPGEEQAALLESLAPDLAASGNR